MNKAIKIILILLLTAAFILIFPVVAFLGFILSDFMSLYWAIFIWLTSIIIYLYLIFKVIGLFNH